MSKTLLLSIFILSSSYLSKGQIVEGQPWTYTYVTSDTMQISDLVTDSSGLWQIGTTNKTFFVQGDTPVQSIMTDTLSYYPASANGWFVLEVQQINNVIVNFRHKYQTDSMHDGGIVEFSNDGGMTWQNVKGDCNSDGQNWQQGTRTENFYSSGDTLPSGEPAFMGTSNGWQLSRFQFYLGPPVKGTASCDFYSLQVRFRFVSDSTADSLDGWIIDSITIEKDYYTGDVAQVNSYHKLEIYPTPSFDGIIYFPPLSQQKDYTLEIINSMGQSMLKSNYKQELNLNQYPKGLYFYRVTNHTDYYSGQILLE